MEVHIFTKNNCRIVKNPKPEDLERYKKMPNVLINPDCSGVRGVPMHYRKIHVGKPFPMNSRERAIVDKSHRDIGVDNCVEAIVPNQAKKLREIKGFLRSAGYFAFALFLVYLALKVRRGG